MYSFDKQLEIGEAAENQLDKFFAQWYRIQPASREQQRQGIDRIYTRRLDGEVTKVEYKTDFRSHETGNAFVETISIDRDGKPGWAFTSQCDYLLYFVYGDLLVYVFPMPQFRRYAVQWRGKFPSRTIPNNGYNTVGVLVPLREFESYAMSTLSL